jgi:hypothetical protein
MNKQLNKRNRRLTGAAVLWMLAAGPQVSGQNAPAPSLSTVHGLKCDFTLMATGTWDNNVPSAVVKPASLSLQFSAIDTQEGTAEMPGINQLGSGAPHIIVRLVEGNLHFLAMNSTGSMYITTVFSDRESRASGKWKAVHTRHEFTEVQLSSFTSRPEQYYGSCATVE